MAKGRKKAMSEDLDPQENEVEDDEENGEEETEEEEDESYQALLEAFLAQKEELTEIKEHLVAIRKAVETLAGGKQFVEEQEKQRVRVMPKKAAKKKSR
jgi:hypothetical protein